MSTEIKFIPKQPVKSTMPAEGNHKKGQKNGALEENSKSLPRSSSSSSSMPSENDSQSSTYVALKQFIESSLERVSTEFESVKSSLKDFDTQHANGRLASASEFLSNSLDDVTKSLTKLKESSKTLLNSTSEVPMKAFSTGLAEAQQALDRLKTLTQTFDKKLEDSGVKQRVSELIEPTRKLATKYLTEISSYITELSKVAFAQLKGVNDALKQRFLAVSETGLQFTLKKAVELDQKFDFESKLKEIETRLEKSGIKENLQKLDEKYAIKSNVESALDFAKNKGKEIDEKWTEGKVTNIFEEAYERGKKMVFQGLEKLQKEFDEAKLKQKGDTRVEN